MSNTLFELPNAQYDIKDHTLRALWFNQPYATLMLHGKIETRTRPTKVRGQVLICSCKRTFKFTKIMQISDNYQTSRIFDEIGNSWTSKTGQAIAIGLLTDCRPMTPHDEDACFVAYRPDLWCWIFEDVQEVEPFDLPGKQGWGILSTEQKNNIIIKN